MPSAERLPSGYNPYEPPRGAGDEGGPSDLASTISGILGTVGVLVIVGTPVALVICFVLFLIWLFSGNPIE